MRSWRLLLDFVNELWFQDTRQGVKNQIGKEVSQMKKTISLLSNLLLASTLFWGVPLVEADELVETEVVGLAGYCHMKFAPMSEGT